MYVRTVINFGVSGMCVSKHSGARNYWNLPQYHLAMGSHPHIVVIQFGTNDVLNDYWDEEKYRKDYTDMIIRFKNLSSKPTVYVNIPSPVYFEDSALNRVNTILPGIVRDIAKKAGDLVVIDLFELMGGKSRSRNEAMNKDGLHANDLGYTAIAHYIANTIANHEHFMPIKPQRAVGPIGS
jgi:acyl-CoA thioesterase I